MPRSNSRSFYPVIILFLLYGAVAVGSGPISSFSIQEVAPGIYVHHGQHAGIEDQARADSANIGFIVGNRCVAVIDTGGSVETGRSLLSVIRETTKLKICYVINTHVHFDHVLGNAAFKHTEAEFVGHQNLHAAMLGNREFFGQEFADELAGAEVIGPDVLVETTRRLDLGDREITLTAIATAHSNTDLIVVDTKTATMWTGDLVFMERLPILDGNLQGWLRWIEQAVATDVKQIVPGHGPHVAPWPQAVAAQQTYLTALLNDGRRAVADGVFLEDALETMTIEEAQKWLVNDRHPRNVSRAYREVEWE